MMPRDSIPSDGGTPDHCSFSMIEKILYLPFFKKRMANNNIDNIILVFLPGGIQLWLINNRNIVLSWYNNVVSIIHDLYIIYRFIYIYD